jgi:hypothetical protein
MMVVKAPMKELGERLGRVTMTTIPKRQHSRSFSQFRVGSKCEILGTKRCSPV